MTPETEAAIEFSRMRLARVLPVRMQDLQLELQARWDILNASHPELPYPEGYDGLQLSPLIELAQNGDEQACRTLQILAVRLLEIISPMPFALSQQLAKSFGRPLPSKRTLANRERNAQICFAINDLVQQGFRPTQNVASRYGEQIKSACSIVCSALRRLGIHLTEDAIEKIWRGSDELLGALKRQYTPGTTKPGTLEEWRRRQREDWISSLAATQGDVILGELGRQPNADGQWTEDDLAALRAECDKRINIA